MKYDVMRYRAKNVITFHSFLFILQYLSCLQGSSEDFSNIEAVYVKEDNIAREGKVRFTVKAVLVQ